ncbi:MAG: hypothetical protein P8N02_10510 [Actinomycetota bacterium]|nr:hypothetical protein [Actinomycetota bacterium]
MDELEDRVRRAALDAMSGSGALEPRDAAKRERAERRDAKAAEAHRVDSLRGIVRKLRAALKDRGDVGTISFRRHRKHRIAGVLSRSNRGWVVADLAAEVLLKGEYAGALRSCELQLLLLTDGKVYAAADGTIYDRFRIGQTYHPEMPVTFPMQAWRDLEDRIPEFVGELVGRLQLTWQVD